MSDLPLHTAALADQPRASVLPQAIHITLASQNGSPVPAAADGTVTARSSRSSTPPDRPDVAVTPNPQVPLPAESVHQTTTVQLQGPLSWPRILLVLAAFFVALVASAKLAGVVVTLVGIGGTVVLVYVGHTMRIQPKDPSKDLMTLTGYGRDVLVGWLRRPAP